MNKIFAITLAPMVASVTVMILWHGGGMPSREQPMASLFALVTVGLVALMLIGAPDARRRQSALRILASTIPFTALAIVMATDPGRAHSWTVLGELGAVLASGAIGWMMLAAVHGRWKYHAVTAAVGGAIGVGSAVIMMLLVNVSPTDQVLVAGWIIGALVSFAVVNAPPKPFKHLPGGFPARLVPVFFIWVVALTASVPSLPRHELGSSDGTLALAIVIVVLIVLATAILWVSEGKNASRSYSEWVALQWHQLTPYTVHVSLLAVGVLQAASYSSVAIDDLGRYWSIADSMANGYGYDTWHAGLSTAQGLVGSRWMDLPVLPTLLLVSFAVTGHTFGAALLPMALAGVFLPQLTFCAARALGVGRTVAFVAAILLTLTPTFQIYSLGAAEPDAIFAILVVAVVWAQARALHKDAQPEWIYLGVLAGLIGLVRPEGPLYALLLVGVAVVSKPSRRSCGAIASMMIVLTPFIALSLALVGRPWPQQPQGLTIESLAQNLDLARLHVWEFAARVLLLNDGRFPVLVGMLVVAFALGSRVLANRQFALLALPLAVLGNLVVTMSISPVALSADEPQEFLRHVGPTFPVFVLVAACGADAVKRAAVRVRTGGIVISVFGVIMAGYFTVGSLYLLATPEEFHHGNRSGSLLRSDIYVHAESLWRHPIELPCPPCLGSDGWDFHAFRSELFDHYRPYDAHSSSDGAAYQTLSGLFAALGFVAVLSPILGRGFKRATPM